MEVRPRPLLVDVGLKFERAETLGSFGLHNCSEKVSSGFMGLLTLCLLILINI